MKGAVKFAWERNGQRYRLVTLSNRTRGYEDAFAVEVRSEDLLGAERWDELPQLGSWDPTINPGAAHNVLLYALLAALHKLVLSEEP